MTIAEKVLRAKADYDAVFEAGKSAGGGAEDLDGVLTEQETLLEELVKAIDEKAAESPTEYEVWTITYTDGTTEEREVVFI